MQVSPGNNEKLELFSRLPGFVFFVRKLEADTSTSVEVISSTMKGPQLGHKILEARGFFAFCQLVLAWMPSMNVT